MRVLLANDPSSLSKVVADYLLLMPFRKPIDLDIVSAVHVPMMADSSLMGMPADLSVFLSDECAATKARVEKVAEDLSGLVHSIHTHVPIGSPSTQLLLLAEQADSDLIVLGAVGHSAIERVLLGSVSDYVATHSDRTTLVVRPPRAPSERPELNKILIALSGSPEDERMIDWLSGFELSHDIEIHLVRVLPLHTFYQQDIRQQASGYWESLWKEAESQISKLGTKVREMGLIAESHLVEADHIGEAVIEYSEQHNCDLIMTGDSDRGLLTRVILGSTSRYVLRHAQCSVVIVRDKEDRRKATEQAAMASKSTLAVV